MYNPTVDCIMPASRGVLAAAVVIGHRRASALFLATALDACLGISPTGRFHKHVEGTGLTARAHRFGEASPPLLRSCSYAVPLTAVLVHPLPQVTHISDSASSGRHVVIMEWLQTVRPSSWYGIGSRARTHR